MEQTTVDYLIAPDRYETPDFTIRSYEPGDGALLHEAISNSYEHLRTFMPWATADYSLEMAERFCRRARAEYLLAQNFTLGVFSPDGRRVLAGTGYHLREGDLSTQNAEIGMWVRADSAGRGFGTRLLLALFDWGFTGWPWLRLSWRCDTRNAASARVAEKTGMTKEGCFRSDYPVEDGQRRDTLLFSMLKYEWQARHLKR